MVLRKWDIHTDLIGKICKLTSMGVEIEKGYEKHLGVGNSYMAERIYKYCYCGGWYEMSLMFIDEPPIHRDGVVLYCLEEIGKGVNGDWHWFSLEQLMICN